MKMHLTSIPRLSLALALASAFAAHAAPVSTCFTFQGQLRNNNGALILTPQDFRVTLYPQATGGNPVGNPSVNTINCVPLANGVFTLSLCFGDPSSYNCEARWLEIAVRPCGGSSYTVLTKRVELLPTPNAIQSLVACSVAANGVSAASIPNGTITENKISSGQVVKSLNTLHDAVNLVAGGPNVEIKDVGGNKLQFSVTESPDLWSRNGADIYYNAGNVGIGTASPISSSKLLSVAATGNGIQGNSGDRIASGVYGENTAQGYGVAGRSGGTGAAVFGDNLDPNGWAGSFNGRLYAAGDVGIGTITPIASLYVRSGKNGPGDNTATFFNPVLGPNASHVHFGGNGDWYIRSASGSGEVVLQDSGGKVGIGPALAGTALSPTLVASTGFMPSSFGHDSALASFGTLAEGNNVSLGLRARRTVVGTGWQSTSLGLTFDVDNTVEAGGGLWLVPGASVGSGRVGIGTTAPLRTLHVEGHEVHSGGPSAGFSFSDRSSTGFVEVPNGTGERWVWYAQNGTANLWSGGNKISVQPNGSLYVAGSADVCYLNIRGGCDLAEPFAMAESDIPKGSLVVIDEDNAGKLKLAGQEYDTRVAGIVSGANGINPGISLHQEGLIEGGQNVALSGRVYALADATHASIKPGDLLTSSSTPGHVMKVTDHVRAQGAIVGKAMSGLKNGRGMVLVLVSLQ